MRQMLNRRKVKAVTGWSDTTLYRKVRKGLFPQPYDMGDGTMAWDAAEVDQWLEDRPLANFEEPGALSERHNKREKLEVGKVRDG